jgi:predicted aminopeptidase
MLADGPGELANTIIHELTHGTIFVPDSMTFNENLATFIGNRGAEAFLKYQFGDTSQLYKEYEKLLNDRMKFSTYIIESTRILDSLYHAFEAEPDSIKNVKKNELISLIINNHDSVEYQLPDRYQNYFEEFVPNNAFFVSFLNYRERQDELYLLLNRSMEGNLADFIDYWKIEYGN